LPGLPVIDLVIRYYNRIGVAGVTLLNTISVGDRLAIAGSSTNFVQQASSIELNRVKVRTAATGQEVGLKVDQPVDVGDHIFRL
jgi:sulfate adenylyltransferase subunit 1 (EFTu-like GTPase family)